MFNNFHGRKLMIIKYRFDHNYFIKNKKKNDSNIQIIFPMIKIKIT